jgi:hypothetical protein
MSIKEAYAPAAFEPVKSRMIDVADWLCENKLATKNSLEGNIVANPKPVLDREVMWITTIYFIPL